MACHSGLLIEVGLASNRRHDLSVQQVPIDFLPELNLSYFSVFFRSIAYLEFLFNDKCYLCSVRTTAQMLFLNEKGTSELLRINLQDEYSQNF
jgi:hypothetical protein